MGLATWDSVRNSQDCTAQALEQSGGSRFVRYTVVNIRKIFNIVVVLAILVVGGQVVATITSTDLNPAGAGTDPYLIVNSAPAPIYPPRIEHGIQSGVDNTGWTVVTFATPKVSPVVIATPSYTASEPSLTTRIRNASSSSFEVRVDRTDGSATAISGVDVHWLVVSVGTYTVANYGIKMEAVRVLSTVTSAAGSWSGQSQTYANTYTAPVVLGQVMTYNDTDWSVFYASESDPKRPPDAVELYVGKHVGEDPDTTRADETIGYIVFEAGTGTFGGGEYEVALGSKDTKGWDDSPPYSYSHSVSGATTVILSSAGIDNKDDGDWLVLIGPSPVSGSDFELVAQEDQEADAEVELGKKKERAAYIVFE